MFPVCDCILFVPSLRCSLLFLCDVGCLLMCLWYDLCLLFIDFIGLFCVCCYVMFLSVVFGVYVLFVVCGVAVCCFIGLSCVYALLLLFCFRFCFLLRFERFPCA